MLILIVNQRDEYLIKSILCALKCSSRGGSRNIVLLVLIVPIVIENIPFHQAVVYEICEFIHDFFCFLT